jgi:uncharacterized membrane protein YeiH
MALQSEPFTLPLSLDLGATFLFGMTGALVALNRGYDVIGLFAVAFLTGVGGGLIRDGVFLQHGPPFVTTGSGYVIVLVFSCIAARLFHRRLARLDQPIAVLEALGLGAYGVIGVQKCLVAGLGVAAAIFVGVVNAVGGGLLRAVTVREEPVLFKPGQFCALAVLCGCCLYALLTLQLGLQPTTAAYITIAVTFLLRILAIRYDWRTRALVAGSDATASGGSS